MEGPKNFVIIVNRFPVDYQRFARLTKPHLSPILTRNQKILLLDQSDLCDDESHITHDFFNFGLTTVIVSVTLGKCANFIRHVCRVITGHLYLDSFLTK